MTRIWIYNDQKTNSADQPVVGAELKPRPQDCESETLTAWSFIHPLPLNQFSFDLQDSPAGYGHLLEVHNQSQGKLHRTLNTNALYFVFPIHLFSYRSQNDVKMSRVKIVSLGALDWLNWRIRMRTSCGHTNLIYCDFWTIFNWFLTL